MMMLEVIIDTNLVDNSCYFQVYVLFPCFIFLFETNDIPKHMSSDTYYIRVILKVSKKLMYW